MKRVFSHAWLQSHIDKPLPDSTVVADHLNRHAFEVESVVTADDGTALYELDILPNRSIDCSCHRGIARELSALFSLPAHRLCEEKPFSFSTNTSSIATERCDRYATLTIKQAKGSALSPEIATFLGHIKQKSIHPIVDLSNYVLFDSGHPVHAFDAAKVSGSFTVRQAKEGETLELLDGRTITLVPDDIVIVDGERDTAIALAGVMGGAATKVDETTEHIYLEIAAFDGPSVRRTARRHTAQTDAAQQCSQNIPPELIDFVATSAANLFGQYGTVTSSTDSRRVPIARKRVTGVSVVEVNTLLGSSYAQADIAGVFDRLHLPYTYANPRATFIETVQKQLGKPYVYGASVTRDAPDAFDCSSLVCWAAAQAGKSVPRISLNINLFAESVDEPEPGDILFTRSEDPTARVHTKSVPEAGFPVVHGTVEEGINHCAIITGPETTIEAEGSSGANKVVEKPLDVSRAHSFGRLFTDEKRFIVSVPVTRPDLRDECDLIEEIGRIKGYDTLPSQEPSSTDPVPPGASFAARSLILKTLQPLGFSEIMTSSFCKKGSVQVARPVAKDKGGLRASLRPGMEQALAHAAYHGELLGLDTVRLIEIGTVFSKEGESVHLALGSCAVLGRNDPDLSALEQAVQAVLPLPGGFEGSVWEVALDDVSVDATQYEPFPPSKDRRYQPPSKYPFVLRDLAVFVPEGTTATDARKEISSHAGAHLRHLSLFDEFEKNGNISFAFRLVFQSDTMTLTDAMVTKDMATITTALERRGYTIR